MDRETLERLRDLGTDWGHTISYPQTKDVLAAVAEIEELRESLATYRKVEAQLVERVAVAESKLGTALDLVNEVLVGTAEPCDWNPRARVLLREGAAEMSDEQARDQLLSCLEDVQDQLEDLHEVTSAVVVSQAMTEIKALSSRLNASIEKWSKLLDKFKEAEKLADRLERERDDARSRLEEAQNHATQWADLAGSHGAMQDGIRRLFEGERAKRIELERMLSRLAEWRETYRGEKLPKLFGILDDVQSRVVERQKP